MIILEANSTVNVTCCVSTLPFSGSLTATVPKILAWTPIVPISAVDPDTEGVLCSVIVNEGWSLTIFACLCSRIQKIQHPKAEEKPLK